MKKQMYYNNRIYSSVGNKITVSEKGTSKRSEYLKIKQLSLMNYFELYNRLLRHGIHNFYKINDNIDCIVIRKKILFFENKKLIDVLNIKNGSRPMRTGIIFRDDYIIYSEYYGNRNRNPINLYKYNFIKHKKEILFKYNNIRHIHCIHQNINNHNKIYIGTGDLDNECAIYEFNLTNKKMQTIGGGSQLWRAVSILQDNKNLYWGTDDPVNKNYIVRYDLQNKKLEKIQEIDGPAYYSAKTKNNEMFIATTIEDRKKHKAIIYKSLDGNKWDKYLEFKKDAFHTKYFGYGIVEFINNQEQIDDVIINLNGLN